MAVERDAMIRFDGAGRRNLIITPSFRMVPQEELWLAARC
jgi:hypothetical protein